MEPAKWTASLKVTCKVLGSSHRCVILRELATTEWLPVTYLSVKAGISRTAASQHMAILKQCKAVETGVGRLYRLAAALRPAPGEEWLDFGHLRLRIPARAAQ